VDASEIKKYRRGKLIHIRLSPRNHQRLKIRVAELGTTMQRFVSRTVRRALLPPKPKSTKKPKATQDPQPKSEQTQAPEVSKKPEETKGKGADK